MAFGSFQSTSGARSQAMAEINMVPLIDIVLVLLVLFILAAPMAAQSVRVSLPRTAAVSQEIPAQTLDLTLRADGVLLSADGDMLDEAALMSLLSAAAGNDMPPVVRIWSDGQVRYAFLADLIVTIRHAGLSKIALMTRTAGNTALSAAPAISSSSP